MCPAHFQPLDVHKIRRDFREEVKSKCGRGLERAVQSPDSKKIESVIIDSYHTTKVGRNP